MRIEAVRRYLEEHPEEREPDPNDPTAWRGIQELFSGFRREMFSPLPEIAAALAIAKAVPDRSRAFALMREYLGAEPTPLMKTRLAAELPDVEEWFIPEVATFLAHHKRFLEARALTSKSKEDIATVREGIKVFGELASALDTLRRGGDPVQGQAQNRDEILAHFIRTERTEDPSAPASEIQRRAVNRIRREGRREKLVRPGPKAAARLPADHGEEHELARIIERETGRQEKERLRRDAGKASLSKGERETFGLILEDHDIVETARIRGRSEDQIRQEKFRALRKIREYRHAAGQ